MKDWKKFKFYLPIQYIDQGKGGKRDNSLKAKCLPTLHERLWSYVFACLCVLGQ